MGTLLQSTSVTKRFTFGSAGLTISVQISKAGGAYANPSAGATNLTDDGSGNYHFSLSATDTNTLGLLTYSLGLSSTQVAPLSGDIEDVVVTSLAQAKDLITLQRAKSELGGAQGSLNLTLSTDETTTLAQLITAASDAIEKYCKRRFLTHSYDELYNGTGDKRLLLRQYPLQSVESVRYRPVTVAKVINNNQGTNQQARVQVTSTGLQCMRVASGVKITETLLTWADNPTLQALMNAVTALGNGWSGSIVGDAGAEYGDYGLWPSADLYVPNSYGDPLEGSGIQTSQGYMNARGTQAELKMHTYELQGYQWDARGWLLRAIPYTDPELLHPEDLIWPVGINNFRIQYTAGYSTVPEAVQDACAMLVAIRFWETKRDPSLMSLVDTTAGDSHGYTDLFSVNDMPRKARVMLQPYRRISVSTNQG